MRLVRFGDPGRERPGILDAGDAVRDLSGVVADIDGEVLTPEGLASLQAIDLATLPQVEGSLRIGPCVAHPGKFLCLGLNYACNAQRLGQSRPKEPVIAMKPLSAVCGAYDDIQLPRGSTTTDWEVELGAVIGRRAQYLAPGRGLDHVAGYCLVNDLADRHLQSARGGDTSKGRGHDSFGPIGPWLVTKDEIARPQEIRLWLEIDGERVQSGWTGDMFVGVDDLVVYLSQFMTLLPGDIVATGTPAGIGIGMKPPRYLRAGQVVRLGGDRLGEQIHHVTAPFDDDETTSSSPKVGEKHRTQE